MEVYVGIQTDDSSGKLERGSISLLIFFYKLGRGENTQTSCITEYFV